MPSEVRLIAFSDDEIREAITEFDAASSKPMLRGRVTTLHIRKKPQVYAIVEVETAGGEEIDSVDLTSSYLAAALISFCKTTRIPLPRKAEKELDVVGDQLVLRLTVGKPGENLLATLRKVG